MITLNWTTQCSVTINPIKVKVSFEEELLHVIVKGKNSKQLLETKPSQFSKASLLNRLL